MRVREQISTFPTDYSKSVSQVYQDVVKFSICIEHDLRVAPHV